LRICEAPLTELVAQRPSQRGCPEEIRMSSDNGRKRVDAQLECPDCPHYLRVADTTPFCLIPAYWEEPVKVEYGCPDDLRLSEFCLNEL